MLVLEVRICCFEIIKSSTSVLSLSGNGSIVIGFAESMNLEALIVCALLSNMFSLIYTSCFAQVKFYYLVDLIKPPEMFLLLIQQFL